MKKIIYMLSLALLIPAGAYAATAVPSQSPSQGPTSSVTKDVQVLKDKLATKVSELRKQNQRAVSGIITSIDAKSISIVDSDDKTVRVTVDEVLTHTFEINGTVKKEVKTDTLEKGDYIIIAGPVTDDVVTANAIYKDAQYLVGSGKITNVDKADFSLSVATEDKESLIIDVENNTKRVLIDSKSLEKEVIGFSKIKEGDTVHFVLNKTGTEQVKNRYNALRIVILPQEYFVGQ